MQKLTLGRSLPLSLIVLIVGAAAGGQDSSTYEYTNGYPNGRFWAVLTDTEKLMYLRGFRDGLTLGAAGVVSLPKALDAMTEMTNDYYANRFTISDHIKEIDKLYSNRENILLPIPAALNYCAKKLSGKFTNAELEQVLINLRRPVPEAVKPDAPKAEK